MIKQIAIEKLIAQGESRENIKSSNQAYPQLTNAVTAVFDITIEMVSGISYSVPVTTRVSYSHPVALFDVDLSGKEQV